MTLYLIQKYYSFVAKPYLTVSFFDSQYYDRVP